MHSTPPVPSAPPAAVIRLRLDRFEALAGALTTDTARAALIGVDRSQFARVRSGQTIPGERFIAGCLAAFPKATFEDLFTVETPQPVKA